MATVHIKIDGFIHKNKYSRSFVFYQHDMSEYGDILVGPHTLEFDYELPEGWNPVAAQVSALEKAKATLSAEFNRRVAQINDEISKLQCLEFTPAGAA